MQDLHVKIFTAPVAALLIHMGPKETGIPEEARDKARPLELRRPKLYPPCPLPI